MTDGKIKLKATLAELSTEQLRELMAALIRARPRCAAATDELLIALDRIGRR